MFGFIGSTTLLATLIQKDPGFIVGPISALFGAILNIIFNILYSISPANSFGFSIIILTIVVRTIMLPLAFKQQKSMEKMQALTPEVDKLKKKYADKKDPESQRAMSAEINVLYQKSGVNPFASFIPLFIQLPLFVSLNYIIKNAYVYIAVLGTQYNAIATKLMSIPNILEIIKPLAYPHIPKKMELDLTLLPDFTKCIHVFTNSDWNAVEASLTPDVNAYLQPLLDAKNGIEHFFGLNLIEPSSLTNMSIIIPILAVITTFLTSYLTAKRTPNNASTNQTQKIMMYVMPLFMGYITLTLSSGVGIYWITSSVYQICQQYFIGKHHDKEAAMNKANSENAKNSDKQGKK